jgi:hypothetical protein
MTASDTDTKFNWKQPIQWETVRCSVGQEISCLLWKQSFIGSYLEAEESNPQPYYISFRSILISCQQCLVISTKILMNICLIFLYLIHIMQFPASAPPPHYILLRSNYSQHSLLRHLSLCSLIVRDVSQAYKTTGHITTIQKKTKGVVLHERETSLASEISSSHGGEYDV